jgi:hypothetical protein
MCKRLRDKILYQWDVLALNPSADSVLSIKHYIIRFLTKMRKPCFVWRMGGFSVPFNAGAWGSLCRQRLPKPPKAVQGGTGKDVLRFSSPSSPLENPPWNPTSSHHSHCTTSAKCLGSLAFSALTSALRHFRILVRKHKILYYDALKNICIVSKIWVTCASVNP